MPTGVPLRWLPMLLLPRCAALNARMPLRRPPNAMLTSVSSRLRCSAVEAPAVAATSALQRQKVASLLEEGSSAVGRTVMLKGWVRTVRAQKAFSFLEVNDGSSLGGLQVVAPSEMASYGVVEELSTGAAVSVVGEIVASKGKGQTIELKAQSVDLVGACPSDTCAPLRRRMRACRLFFSSAAQSTTE